MEAVAETVDPTTNTRFDLLKSARFKAAIDILFEDCELFAAFVFSSEDHLLFQAAVQFKDRRWSREYLETTSSIDQAEDDPYWHIAQRARSDFDGFLATYGSVQPRRRNRELRS